ncbi:hypothetical protein M2368_002794 [Arthrobacter sp. JUb119]|uniref:hypothetical protein n=1 Tax=unclassified Glutamicibacter TaxID=2627139 RepID=UPI002A2E7473|nr:hypothetical protein [Arthrobacter sp. JUb119]
MKSPYQRGRSSSTGYAIDIESDSIHIRAVRALAVPGCDGRKLSSRTRARHASSGTSSHVA